MRRPASGTSFGTGWRPAPKCSRSRAGELRARAGRAGRELDRVRGELATQRHGAGEEDAPCAPQQPGGGGTGIARNKEAPART